MRDDVYLIFESIRHYQEKKISLLTDFLNIEFEIKHLISGKIEDEIFIHLDSENSLIEEIDICDYNLSSLYDKIKVTCGIDPRRKDIAKYLKNETQFIGFRERLDRIDKILNDIDLIKTENIKMLQNNAGETSKLCDELNSMDRIKRGLSKDFQSF